MKKGIKIVCLAASLLFAAAAGTFAGYWLGRQHSPAQTGDLSDNGVPSADETQTFYATIREIRGNNWLVEGLSVNDTISAASFPSPYPTKPSWSGGERTKSRRTLRRVIPFPLPLRERYRKPIPPAFPVW